MAAAVVNLSPFSHSPSLVKHRRLAVALVLSADSHLLQHSVWKVGFFFSVK